MYHHRRIPGRPVIYRAQHIASGEVYIIEETDSAITGVCGPLHHTEYNDPNWPTAHYNWEPEDLDWAKDELGKGHFRKEE